MSTIDPMLNVRIIKDWNWPDLRRQTPGQTGIWDDIRFTLDPVPECDVLVVLNNRMRTPTRVRCPAENVWALMQEPYLKGFTDWMVEKHQPFARFFTHYPASDHPRYAVSQPALPWHVNRSFDELLDAPLPEKRHQISWVVGNARDLPGHRLRYGLFDVLQAGGHGMDIDLFGRAVQPIEDKWDGLAPYRYSLAVENTSGPDYWTEKLSDCFLSWTVPIYFGCTNLEDYFPSEAFIRLDIRDPAGALERLRRILDEDRWQNRLEALAEARRRVLLRYQLFPWLTDLIRRHVSGQERRRSAVVVPAYRRSLRATFYHWGYKMLKERGMRIKP